MLHSGGNADPVAGGRSAGEGAISLIKPITLPLPILSADETQLTRLHTITMMLSLAIVAYLMANVGYHMSKAHSVHAAVLWVMVAADCDAEAASEVVVVEEERIPDGLRA